MLYKALGNASLTGNPLLYRSCCGMHSPGDCHLMRASRFLCMLATHHAPFSLFSVQSIRHHSVPLTAAAVPIRPVSCTCGPQAGMLLNRGRFLLSLLVLLSGRHHWWKVVTGGGARGHVSRPDGHAQCGLESNAAVVLHHARRHQDALPSSSSETADVDRLL